MPSLLRLDILRELRERAGLSQSDMARLCGLHGRQSHQTAGAWERGDMVPHPNRRAKFIGYLWDHLRLGQEPARFESVWAILVDEWDWEPVSDREWAEFTRIARPAANISLEEKVAQLEAVLNQRVGHRAPPASTPARNVRTEGATPGDPASELSTDPGTEPGFDPTSEEAESEGASPEHKAYDAILYSQAGNPRKPEILFGRDWLMLHLVTELEQGKHLLLTGYGGTGKTALAATVADQWLGAGKGALLWLGADGEKLEELLEAMIAPFGAQHELAQKKGDAQIQAVQSILAAGRVSLVVLDNLQHSHLLPYLRRSLPPGVPLLVTSRYDAATLDECIRIHNLAGDDILSLLAHHAQNDRLDLASYASDPQSRLVCEMLNHHSLGVVIAGGWLKQNRRPAADLVRRLQARYLTPLTIELPTSGRNATQPTVQLLLDQTFAGLEEKTQKLFRSFGALNEAFATSELLAVVVGDDLFAVESALDELVAWNFAERDGSNFYRLHDIIHLYARHLYQQASEPENGAESGDADGESSGELARARLERALLTYIVGYAYDYRNLHQNLPNLLACIEASGKLMRLEMLEPLLLRGFFDAYGYRAGILALMDAAIGDLQSMVAGKQPEVQMQIEADPPTLLHYFQSKRGNGSFDRGDYGAAMQSYGAALKLAPNEDRKAKLTALVAKATAFEGDLYAAARAFSAAYSLADEDDYLMSFVLEQEAHAAGFHQDYATAQRVAATQVEVNRRLIATEPGVENQEALVHSLANLGTAMLRLGNTPLPDILAIHHEAVAIVQTLDNPELKAHVYWALGEAYHHQGDRQSARQQLIEAHTLYAEQGNVRDQQEVYNFMVQHHYSLENG